jgi:hypothetical protein
MQLRNCGVYRFNDAATSLYCGLELIADRTLYGYALYTAAEWEQVEERLSDLRLVGAHRPEVVSTLDHQPVVILLDQRLHDGPHVPH